MEFWKSEYLNVWEEIECLNRDLRWEFDCECLFMKLDYVVDVCVEFSEMVIVVSDFRTFFSSRFKVVIFDVDGVDEIFVWVDVFCFIIEML